MPDPRRLPDDRLREAVRAAYGIPVTALTFLPIGLDAAAWTYRVHAADGVRYFLKVRTSLPNAASLLIPRFLQSHGVSRAAAPIPSSTDTLSVDVGGRVVILYPFIDGATGLDAGMTERHWITLGATLRQMHTAVLPPDLARILHRETFVPPWSDVVRQVDAYLTTRPLTDPIDRDLAASWGERRAEIMSLVERAAILGQRLRATAPPLVLCHTDIHPANIMIDQTGEPWVVDWDEVAMAPKECDLMFAVGGLGHYLAGPREHAWFFTGYGAATVDPLALTYYRYARAVGDIGGFGEEAVLLPHAAGEARQAAIHWFKGLFAPGAIMTLAYEADAAVSP